jgi:transcriptional regulator with XRE-family HTH domain
MGRRAYSKRVVTNESHPVSEDHLNREGHPLGPGNYHYLSRTTRLSRSHLTRVLRGKVGTEGVSLDAAARIADAAGVTLDELRAYIEKKIAERAQDGLPSRSRRHERVGLDNSP